MFLKPESLLTLPNCLVFKKRYFNLENKSFLGNFILQISHCFVLPEKGACSLKRVRSWLVLISIIQFIRNSTRSTKISTKLFILQTTIEIFVAKHYFKLNKFFFKNHSSLYDFVQWYSNLYNFRFVRYFFVFKINFERERDFYKL